MCGIAGVYIGNDEKSPFMGDKDALERFVNGLLLGIEPRGRDATGVVSTTHTSTEAKLCKADTLASSFVHWRDPLCDDVKIVLCHTRFATKGDPMNLLNDHPVQYGSVYVTHNGHISNDDELFKKHELNRLAQVDTEIIPAMLDLKGLNKAHLALQELLGNYAVAAIDPTRFPGALLLAKGPGSPLEFVNLPGGTVVWASTREAINKAWREVWPDQKIDDFRFSSLRMGELLLFEDGKYEEFEFKVRDKWPNGQSPYSPSQHRTSSQTSTYITIGDPRLRELCECLEPRYWHSNHDYSGPCIKKFTMVGGQHRIIKCTGFKKLIIEQAAEQKALPPARNEGSEVELRLIDNETGEIVDYRRCLGCHGAFAVDEMVLISGHLVCDGCNAEAEEYEDDEIPRHDEAVMSAIAERLGLKVAFVEYLLYEAEDEDFDDDPWLVQVYCAIDDEYHRITKSDPELDRQLNLDRELTDLVWTCRSCERAVHQHACPDCGRTKREAEEAVT